MPIDNPILSIIIPCFNQGHFLGDAINSIYKLQYTNLEIIIVDDGSTDITRNIAEKHPDIRYHYQKNGGLASARNLGISIAKGDFVSFLDADDWYLKDGLITNLKAINERDDIGFISGCHIINYEDGHEFMYCVDNINKDHYKNFLEGNYIGNPSAVIYRREILEKFPFDNSNEIVGCEDYDQYLRIARSINVMHNPIPISVYRRHLDNMSNNHVMMLNSVLNVLNRQKAIISTEEEKQALNNGIAHWMDHYNFFPITLKGKKTFQSYHWELIKKYNFRLPEIFMRKIGRTLKSKTK
jgi:glycosyltransferase involved in cell wall biosynthesis